MCYTLEELTQRPLPTEVDPTKMEMYLTDHSFQVLIVIAMDCFQYPYKIIFNPLGLNTSQLVIHVNDYSQVLVFVILF